MFFTLGLIAVLGYSLQSVLMASYYRKMDSLAAISYRGLSLGISMLPMLFFADPAAWQRISDFSTMFFVMPMLGALANPCAAMSYRFLPVGITQAIQHSTTVVFMSFFGVLIWGEVLSYVEILFILLMIFSYLYLGFQRNDMEHLSEQHFLKGAFYAVLFAFFISCSSVFLVIISRELDPFIAGYFWELGIGISGVIYFYCRNIFKPRPGSELPFREFIKILICSSPTLLGTACYAFASTIGPVAILIAILSTMVIMSAVIAHFMYKESLTFRQWSAITLVLVAVVGLKVV